MLVSIVRSFLNTLPPTDREWRWLNCVFELALGVCFSAFANAVRASSEPDGAVVAALEQGFGAGSVLLAASHVAFAPQSLRSARVAAVLAALGFAAHCAAAAFVARATAKKYWMRATTLGQIFHPGNYLTGCFAMIGGGAAVQLVLCAVTIGVGTFDGDYEAETQRFYHQTYVLVMYCNAM